MRRTLLVLATITACKYPALPPLGSGDGGTGSDGSLPPGSPMIAAVTPAIATVGTTLALDGTFSDPMTVNFPGGVTATATVLGKHRATVVVPNAATSGPLTASTGGVTTNAVVFRTPSFVPGLANFRTEFEQTDVARMAPALAAPRSGAGTAVVGQNLYVIGGKSGSTYLDTIEHALINADGTLGTFALVTGTTLTVGRAGATTVVLGGYVYVIGGTGAGGPLASVERAQIQADGTLAAFATVSGVALATARGDAASAIAGDSLYVIGGSGASGMLGSIEAAVIDPDGTLEAFTAVTPVLATPRAGATAFVAGGHLYVLGGAIASGLTSSVEDSPLAPDGTLGAFVASTSALTAPRAYFSLAVLGTNVYATGGTGPSGDTPSTEIAALQIDGSIGTFTTSTTGRLRIARHGAATAVARDHVFLLGGNTGTADVASVEHSSIATHGMLGAFAKLAGEPLAGSRAEAGTVTIGDHLYFVGGVDLATLTVRMDVDSAIVNPDGSLGPFGLVSGVALTAARQSSSYAVIGNYLYAIGGRDESGTNTGVTSLERAPINPDGTLGTFAMYSSATLSTGRGFAAVAITGNNLYVIGGTAGGNQAVTSVDQAVVAADGSISFFFNSGSTHLAVAHANFSAAVIGGYCYIFGGTDTSGISTKVFERAPIQSDGSLGTFANELINSSQAFLAQERALSSNAIVGDDLYLVAGADNVGSPADPGLTNVDHATIASDGTLGTFAIASGATLPEGDFYHSGATVGNYVYVLGGGSHTNANTGLEVKQAQLP